jgi:uncharacterized YccA/Bax inhibitor family protein
MRTSNPTLSESAFTRLQQSAGATAYGGGYAQAPGQQLDPFGRPVGPPVAATRTGRFTVEGAIYKTLALLAILVVAAAAAAVLLPVEAAIPALVGGTIVGLVLVIVLAFKPDLAPVLAPVYALVEGVVLGVVTVIFEEAFPGVASQAAVGTFATLGVMLVLYRTGVIRVTQRFRMVVLAATGAIFVTYLLSFVFSLFGDGFSFLTGSSLLSIGISVVVIGVAALNLALDFDFIERGAQAGLPARMEWYAAFGLLVTLVWLYLEILRLLAILRGGD